MLNKMMPRINYDELLHAAAPEALERRIMELALERTGARHGAIFTWDPRRKALVVGFHVVEGVVVTVPGGLISRARRPPQRHRPARDGDQRLVPHERHRAGSPLRDLLPPVRSIAAVPIRYQRRPIGVISVSARETGAFGAADVADARDPGGRGGPSSCGASSSPAPSPGPAAGRSSSRGCRRSGSRWSAGSEQVAQTDAPVLIHGESGTGKELVANAIHFNSRRADSPLVVVNCAAIPEGMLESILFGHVRGAFTGATFDKIGEFQKADGGTLFLDELGELPMALQRRCCGRSSWARCSPSAATGRPAAWTCASSAPPTATCPRWWPRGSSATTSSTAWR